MNTRSIRPVGIVVVILLIGAGLGFRVTHPHDGLRNALGAASSGIVIYRPIEVISVGQTVMVKVDGVNKSPILGSVSAVDKGKIEIQTGTAKIQTDAAHVMGKMQAVVPFIGQLLGIVGL